MLVRSDMALPLFEAALSIAQDAYPDLPMVETLARVDAFGLELRRRFERVPQAAARVRMAREYFADELGFRGNVNDYYDPDNSYLNRVIERRLGIPISLAVLYMEISEQAGLPAVGLGFPGHFLVAHPLEEGHAVVDVFAGARTLSADELEERLLPYASGDRERAQRLVVAHLQAVRPRDLLARMLRNLQTIYQQRDDRDRLEPIERRLGMLSTVSTAGS
ncbi:MAG: SirB1 family protein [Burkholderiaceae bacterium]